MLAAAYREPANLFEIMDNTSMWFHAKNDEEYRRYWEGRFGITAEDQRRFDDYREVRKRYFTFESGHEQRVFAPNKPVDRVAEAFYSANTMEHAFNALAAFMAPDDVRVLRAFFDAYAEQDRSLLAESVHFREVVAAVAPKLAAARVGTEAARIADFYGAKALPTLTVLYVWWPPVEHTTASQRNRFLVLKRNPDEHVSSASDDVDVILHELAHYASAHQPEEQKRRLAEAFLAHCAPPETLPPSALLEEPLAVVHQKLFLAQAEGLDWAKPWYGGDPWVGPFAKLIYGDVSRARSERQRLDEGLVVRLGDLCSQMRPEAR